MIEISANISKQKNDILQKYTSGLFRDATLAFYGVKTAKIKELINTELDIVEVRKLSTDYVFLLEDNTYQHLEFQTAYNKNDLLRFAKYDLYLYERDKREINTVVIYSSDVNNVAQSLKIGSLTYSPKIVMLNNYDGGAIFTELETKLKEKQDLSDADMLNLIFLPLLRSDISKYDLAKKSIEMAKTISDETKQDTCIASTVAFVEKYLTKNEINEILEAIKMTKVAEMLIADAVEEKAIKIATKMLLKNKPIDEIIEFTDLSEKEIKDIKKKLKK